MMNDLVPCSWWGGTVGFMPVRVQKMYSAVQQYPAPGRSAHGHDDLLSLVVTTLGEVSVIACHCDLTLGGLQASHYHLSCNAFSETAHACVMLDLQGWAKSITIATAWARCCCGFLHSTRGWSHHLQSEVPSSAQSTQPGAHPSWRDAQVL